MRTLYRMWLDDDLPVEMVSAGLSASVCKCVDMKQYHGRTWLNRSRWGWFLGLVEEVVELGLALAGLHPHSADFELGQIASIAMNWHEREAIRQAVPVEGEQSPLPSQSVSRSIADYIVHRRPVCLDYHQAACIR